MSEFNKNDKQAAFNQIKGKIVEINIEPEYCNVVLSVGHENVRLVNFSSKRHYFDKFKDRFSVGMKVSVRFYITSRKKHDRWYTAATLLDMIADS